MERIKYDFNLTPSDKTILEAISIYTDQRVQEELKVNEKYSAAYVQHYGLYSQLLDFTSDLDICSRFASSTCSSDKPGRICVLDVKKANKNSITLDLGIHPFAARARRQRAYGVYNHKYNDFKNTTCIKEMGLTWYEFKRNNAPDKIATLDIYNTNDDKFAGHISLIIDDCINENGKITSRAAEVLSKRVDRVPLFAVTSDLHKINFKKLEQNLTAQESGLSECEFYLASASELNCKVDIEQQKHNSYRKWSIENQEPIVDIEYQINAPVFAIVIKNFRMLKMFNFR